MNKTSIRKRVLKPLLWYLIFFIVTFFVIFNLIIHYIINLDTYSPTLVLNTNLLFFSIFLVLVLSFIFVVIKISTSLSDAIKDLAKDAIKLSRSTYNTEEIKTFNTLEIEELNLSIHKLAKRLFDYYNSQNTAIENASHELRTPLMSIQGYAEAIKCDVFDDITEPLDIIIDSSNHLKDIIEGILTLSKMDSHSIEIEYEYVNLYNTLNITLNKLRGLAYKTNKSIILKGNTDFSFYTDEKLVSQAILNIVSNGLRYAKNTVVIDFSINNDFVIIHICDDGDGIKEDDIKKVFTRFYKGEEGNFGLGLSIAQSSIKYLNGEIMVYNSTPGACFDIILPLKRDTI